MRIGELVNVSGKWVTYTDEGSGESFDLKIRPKTGGLEKRISRKSVTTRVKGRGRMQVESNSELALKMLIDGCLLDWRGLVDGENAYPFTKENAFTLFWDGPIALLDFFERECDQATEEAAAGNE